MKNVSIKEAIMQIEKIRNSTVISYMASQEALIGPEDAGLLVDSIWPGSDDKRILL